MALVLEIEYLSGVAFAAVGPDSGTPDWPPQPDRVFSALVATWAILGQDADGQRALEWLEALPAPMLLAPEAPPRTDAVVFVPPNDPRSDRRKHARGVLPALRSRQPRRFPASRPHDPVVRLCWPDARPDPATFAALLALARDTAYVGHSASLTRCRFLRDDAPPDPGRAAPPRRRVYAGRLAELCRSFEAGRRPLPGARVAPAADATPPRTGSFGGRWLVFEHVAGDMPDLRACALVAKTLRDALLDGYRRIGRGDDIPEVVSGHAPDRSPSRDAHLAVLPLPFAGFPHADGHVMGFALVPPRDSTLLDDADFRRVLRTLAPIAEDHGRRLLTLTTKAGTPRGRAFSIGLSPTFEPPVGRRSLDPALYTRPAPVFATMTPIALDRHLKRKGAARQDEAAAQIADACRNVGLPEPDAVVCDKHSAIVGAPSAYPAGGAPAWTRWGRPRALASRHLTHAVIRFARPVDGPVVLGAGRFVGLGLCRALDPDRR